MTSFRPAEFRILTSTLAIAAAVLFLTPNVEAIDFTWNGGTADWDNPANWDGGVGIPDGNNDTATIAVNTDPDLNSNRTVGAVTILTNGDLDLNGFQLLVQNNGGESGTTSISGSSGSLTVRESPSTFDLDTDFLVINSSGDLIVQTGAVAQVDQDATINSGGQVRLINGELEVGDFLDLNDGSEIFGDGLIQTTGTSNLSNDGTIRASGGTLTIDATSTGGFDWDGGGGNGAAITVDSNSTLDIDMTLSDTVFNGTITLNSNSLLDTAGFTWTLGVGPITDPGILNKNGTGIGTVIASTVTLSGATTEVNINDGTLVFDTNLTANSGSTISMTSGTSVEFNGTTNINDGAIFNNGGAYNMTIGGNTTITSTGDFNLDGNGVSTNQISIGSVGSLTLNVDQIDLGDNQFDATLNINGGSLAVNITGTEWTMDGVMNLTGSSTITGDKLGVDGIVNVTSGSSVIGESTDFDANADLNISNGATLTINNSGGGTSVRFEPGAEVTVDGTLNLSSTAATTWTAPTTVNGTGTINQNMNSIVTGGETIINTAVYNWDGGGNSNTTINSTGTLTINAEIEAGGNEQFDGNLIVNGVLNVNNQPWIADGSSITSTGASGQINGQQLTLRGAGSLLQTTGTLTIGADLVLDDQVDVRLLTIGSLLDFNGDVTYNGTTVNEDFAATVRHDGNVNVIGGITTIDVSTMNVSAGTTIDVAAGASFRFTGGDANFAAGTHTGGGILRIVGTGTTTITGDTVIETAILDWDGNGGDFTVNSGIAFTINSDEIDNSGEAFDTGTITLESNSDLNVNTLAAWTLGPTATLTMNSGSDVSGSEIIVRGTINSNGGINDIFAPVTFESTATVNVNSGDLDLEGTTTFRGGTFTGPGDIFQGGDVNVQANTTIGLGGSYNWDHGSNVLLTVNSGATFTINSNTGSFSADTMVIQDTATLAVNGPTQSIWTVGTTSTVTLQGAAVAFPFAIIGGTDAIVNDGTISGNGRILVDLTNDDGTVSPGLSAGHLLVTQNYVQNANGTLEIELGGTTAITQHDQLNVGLAATLAGTLDLSLIGGYLPLLGDTLDILTTGAGLGGTEFDLVNQPPTMPLGLAFDVNYLPTIVQLEVVFTVDLDGDGGIDGRDFLLIQRTDPSLIPAWESQFGNCTAAPCLLAAASEPSTAQLASDLAAVPEPSSIVLAGMFAIGMLIRRQG